jgi:hypothetical protein
VPPARFRCPRSARAAGLRVESSRVPKPAQEPPGLTFALNSQKEHRVELHSGPRAELRFRPALARYQSSLASTRELEPPFVIDRERHNEAMRTMVAHNALVAGNYGSCFGI